MATGARIRVVLFITELALGGTPRRLQALAERLDRTRFEPLVLSVMPGEPRGPSGGGDAIADALQVAGVPVETLGVRRKADLWAPLRLLAYLRRVRPQILHAFNFHANLLAKLVGGKLARVPVVIASEASVESAKPRLRVAFDRLTACWADGHHVNAEAVRRTLVGREGVPPDRIWLVPTGVDAKAFAPQVPDDGLRSALGIAPGERIVVCVGRLAKYKGQEVLLAACALDRTGQYRLVFVGDGPDRPALEARAAALGVAARVVFAGARNDVAPFLALADCVALASTEEGMPGSVLEAMSMARPVVATAVGGVPEAIEDGGTGLLAPPGDPGALARAIAAMLADPARAQAMGRAARDRAERAYAMDRMVRETQAMYETLVAGGAGAPRGGTA